MADPSSVWLGIVAATRASKGHSWRSKPRLLHTHPQTAARHGRPRREADDLQYIYVHRMWTTSTYARRAWNAHGAASTRVDATTA